MLYLNKISWYLGFQGIYNASITKALHGLFFFHMWKMCRDILIHVKPSLNCHLCFFFLLKEGLKFLICGVGNSISPLSIFFALSGSFFRPSLSLPLPPGEPGSILLFRSLSAVRKSRADVTNLVLRRNHPNQTKVFHLIDSWPSGSLWTQKLGRFSFSLFFFFFFCSRFSKRALKSTLSLIQ